MPRPPRFLPKRGHASLLALIEEGREARHRLARRATRRDHSTVFVFSLGGAGSPEARGRQSLSGPEQSLARSTRAWFVSAGPTAAPAHSPARITTISGRLVASRSLVPRIGLSGKWLFSACMIKLIMMLIFVKKEHDVSGPWGTTPSG